MEINFSELMHAVAGKVLSEPIESTGFRAVSTDTRTVGKNDLFFALAGPHFDGHTFIQDALEKGATAFVVSNEKFVTRDLKTKAAFILVGDTLKAYGNLACFYRQKFKIPLIAITGSSGKTTVKELVAHVLSGKFKVLKNKGTENNLVGVPKTIFELNASHEAAILEMGTSGPGEIDALAKIASPQIGVLTQIGFSHLEGLKGIEGVKKEKLSMVKHVARGGILILNGQDENLRDIKSGVHKVVRVGMDNNSVELNAEKIRCDENGCSFYVGDALFETSLIGRHNILNCLFAIAVASELRMEIKAVQKGIASFKAVPGRLCLKNSAGIHFIDDTYNANPTSFMAALETLNEFRITGKKGVVCGDMLELGSFSEEFHRAMGRFMADCKFDFVVACGPQSKFLVEEALKTGFNASKIFYAKDSAEAAILSKDLAAAGDVVLVKGSRGMKMEKVFECYSSSSTH